MLSEASQKAIIAIVTLTIGWSVRSDKQALFLILGLTLGLAVYSLSSILSFLKRLYSAAPRNAVSKPCRVPMVHLYDPETGQMSAIPRSLIIKLFDGRKDNSYE